MGFQFIELNIATGFSPDDLKHKIAKKLRIPFETLSYTIERQSLDARDKRDIHWKIRAGVSSPGLKGAPEAREETLHIAFQKKEKHIVVVGSGPAGFFAAYTAVCAGFRVTILEQGPEVDSRLKHIVEFERSGVLNEKSNYAFGEGGAGTFSDGKLTSRTKTISIERKFIIDTYIEAGAPPEIGYLSSPHLGSDNLRKIVKRLREKFIERGGNIFFDSQVTGIEISGGNTSCVKSVETTSGKIEGDYFIFACGHSSYETYRMLMGKGIPFRVKPFALGCRVEHSQEEINISQWGVPALKGVKSAEYKLTFNESGLLPVYSFCMCPGGKVVPASAYAKTQVVNGMSNYLRSSPYANSAIVAGVDLNQLLQKELNPTEALEWLERLEQNFYNFSGSYAAPALYIHDFIEGKISGGIGRTSYPLGVVPADFEELLPAPVIDSIRAGMKDFCRKIKGFEKGLMLGLESKTSSPVQALREKNGKSLAMENLYLCGEGSGYSGGIISSGADGIKAVLDILSV